MSKIVGVNLPRDRCVPAMALLVLVIGVLVVACSPTVSATVPALTTAPAVTPDASRSPALVLTLTANRLAKPEIPATNPSQADEGAVYYWWVCLPCHGDQGQGLTDEWREVYGPDEMNCWQSGCHGKRHPSEGFELPHAVPAILGPGALTRFTDAQELHHVIATSMPWWGPSFMTSEQSWQVTAYLLRQSGWLPDGMTLNEGNASIVRLRVRPVSKIEEQPVTIALIGLLAVGAITFVVHHFRPGPVAPSAPYAHPLL